MHTFTSKREFGFLDYSSSHRLCLFRASEYGGTPYNIDLVFEFTQYFNVPLFLRGVEIEEVESSLFLSESRKKVIHFFDNGSLRVFRIRSEGEDFFVVAAGYRVFRNKLLASVSSFDDRSDSSELIFDSTKGYLM